MKHSKLKTFIILFAITLVGFGGSSLTSLKQDYFEMSKQLEIMNSVFRELNIYYVDPLSPGEIVHTGIDAMLESLDPYTRYYPEEKMEDVRFISTGEYGGIGISLKETWDGLFIVTNVRENSPAEKAGLNMGDQIASVKGKNVEGTDVDIIGDQIKGPSGTDVELGIIKYGEVFETAVTLERMKIKSPDIPYSGMISEKTGYLILDKFTKTASSEVKKALVHLTDSLGAENIVLDLRGNGGGLLREAVNIVNFFVPKGTEVVEMRGKTEAWNKSYKALRNPLLKDIPLAVLIDEKSASASEIVSGALQELDRAVIIGRESFGKGLVQQTKDLAYGSRMKITVAKYYTPSGRCVQRVDYSGDGVAIEAADSTLKVFYTANGRPILEGRGVFPDLEVDAEYYGYVLGGLLKNDVFFDFVISRPDIIVEDPSSYRVSDELYNDFIAFVQSEFASTDRKAPYECATNEILEILETSLKDDGLLEENATLLETFKSSTAANILLDMQRNEDQIRTALEEEIVYHKTNTTGLFQYQLPKDQNSQKAIEILESGEYKNILLGPAK